MEPVGLRQKGPYTGDPLLGPARVSASLLWAAVPPRGTAGGLQGSRGTAAAQRSIPEPRLLRSAGLRPRGFSQMSLGFHQTAGAGPQEWAKAWNQILPVLHPRVQTPAHRDLCVSASLSSHGDTHGAWAVSACDG